MIVIHMILVELYIYQNKKRELTKLPFKHICGAIPFCFPAPGGRTWVKPVTYRLRILGSGTAHEEFKPPAPAAGLALL